MAGNTCKIKISVEWHGDQVNQEIEQQWWDQVTAKEILFEIQREILSLEA